jgi:hypothetical protein
MQKYGISTTSTDGATPSKLEAEARKPSPFEALPLLELGSIAFGVLVGVGIGYNSGARDITPYVVNCALIGAALPIVAVVIYSTAQLAYGMRMNALYTFERWSQLDANKDNVIGDPQGEHTDVLLPVNIPKQEPTVRLAGAERTYRRDDLAWLVRYVYENPTWAGRNMRGMRLPSGDILVDYDADVVPFLDILERMNLLVGRGAGSRGNLVGDANEALARLRIPQS